MGGKSCSIVRFTEGKWNHPKSKITIHRSTVIKHNEQMWVKATNISLARWND